MHCIERSVQCLTNDSNICAGVEKLVICDLYKEKVILTATTKLEEVLKSI